MASSLSRTRRRRSRAWTRAPRRCAWRWRWRVSGSACMKSARRQAREIALQALYAWQLSGDDPLAQARTLEGFERTDGRFVESLLVGVLSRADELRALIAPHLSREFGKLSPIERAILYIGT